MNFYIGQSLVATSRFDHDLQAEIDRFNSQGTTTPAPGPGRNYFRK